MAPLALLPDAARLVSSYLRAHADVAELAGERVYTAFPKQLEPDVPFVLVQRIGGAPVLERPLVIDLAVLQLDAYGGPQTVAHELVTTCRAALVELDGEQPDDAGNVCAVAFGPLRYVPDEAFRPPRPRYVADLELTTKPSATVLAGAARTSAKALAGAT